MKILRKALQSLAFILIVCSSILHHVHSEADVGMMSPFASFKLESANGGCIGLDEGLAEDGNEVILVDCESVRSDLIWSIDTLGFLHSTIDEDYCLTAFNGRRSRDIKLRLYPCTDVESIESQLFDMFEFYDSGDSGQIRLFDDLCAVYQGINANIGTDSIVMKDCDSVDYDRSNWIAQDLIILNEQDDEKKPSVEFDDPFDVELPYFSERITKVYSDPNLSDFDKDLAAAAAIVVNKQIRDNINPPSFGGIDKGEPIFALAESAPLADTASASNAGAGDVTDFETNVQEKGVDEADIIKADANYIYASYGDYVVVWNTFGKKIKEIKMPDIPQSKIDSQYSRWRPKPHIDSLVLTSGYLVVFVSGYGNSFRDDLARPAILHDYLGTQIRVYSTPDLKFKGMKNINGRYVDARSVGSNVYAVTSSAVNRYRTLIEPLDRFQNFRDMSDEEYYVAAQEEAAKRIIPDFLKSMRDELSPDGVFPDNFLQINRWQRDRPEDEKILDLSFTEGVANNVVWVTSFDVLGKLSNVGVGEIDVSTSSFIAPYSWIHMYGTQDQIILATQGWNWNAEAVGQEQSTYLLGLNMNGPSTEFISVGTVPGHLLNSFALDIHDGELRVATTVSRRIMWLPMPFIEPVIMPRNGGSRNLQEDVVLEQPFLIMPEPEPDAMPLPPIQEESSTDNFVIILKLQGDENGQMTEKGRVKIGEPNESIFAVRFFDDFAYVVTFERTDPFYVIDLHVPKAIGEFKLNGFSSYLHPMTPDNKLLIGVGQNATDDGRTTGLMITIFNATDPANPVAIVSHTVENEDNRYSSSDAEWEHKSFRYINGKLILPLNEYFQTIDPQTGRYNYDSFQGFAVFNVTTEAIDSHFRVSHKSKKCHYCGGWLPPRTFIYSGNLMTVRDSTVTSTDLDSGDWLWTMDIVIEGEQNSCC